MADYWDDLSTHSPLFGGFRKAHSKSKTAGRGGGFGSWMEGFGGGFMENLTGTSEKPGILGLGERKPGAVQQIDPGAAQINGYDQWRAQLAAQAQAAQGRQGPTLDTGPQSAVRAQQDELSRMLMDQAMGKGPSIADMQLRQASDRNMQQAMSLGAAQAGGTRGAGAMRQIGNQRAQIGQQQAMDSGMLRAQEMMAGRGLASQHFGGMRGQDIGLASEQARIALAGQQQNDELVRFFTSQGLDLDKAQMAANLQMQGMKSQESMKMEEMAYKNWNQTVANRSGLLGNLFSFGMGGGGSGKRGGGPAGGAAEQGFDMQW